VQDGTAAPPIDIAHPVRDEDRPASRHKLIGRWGVGVSIAAATLYLLALGSAIGRETPGAHDAWVWGRSSLITVIVVALVLAAYGYGVDASDRRAERVAAAVKTATAAALAAVEDSRIHMHDDHAALHRENVQLREMIGPLVEAAGRLQAFEEQRAFEVAALRQDVKDLCELVAVLVQESPPARVLRLQPGRTDGARKPRQRGRGGREQRGGGDPQEPASAAPAAEPAWTRDDERWQADVAEAAKLGRQLGPGPEPA
jgi:hypothetical protein